MSNENKNGTTEQQNNMNPNTSNKKAIEVYASKGDASFCKHVFTGDKDQEDEGKRLTYAEMRERKG